MNNTKKSLARYLSVQAIYEIFITKKTFEQILKEYIDSHVNNVSIDFQHSMISSKKQVNKNYFIKIIQNCEKEKKKIKQIIEENLDIKWTYQRLPLVLRSILTVCVSEMMISRDLSIGIIASEYIILSETFCSENESSFVNALIENIFKNINVKT